MEKTRFLLIGGLAAVSAARQLAACDPEVSISIVNNEAYPPGRDAETRLAAGSKPRLRNFAF
jgi:hypothetical protein